MDIIGLFVEGYASPDGNYTSNERLSENRSRALADYIVNNFGIDRRMIRVSSVAEDWDGLRLLIEESSILQKNEILAIIDSSDDPDRKEQRLKALGSPWRTMLTEMFPSLRRVEYQIDFTVKDYTVEESKELARRNPELLSQRELFLLAQTYPAGSPEEAGLYESIIRLFPDDPVAILNYSALLLERGETVTAGRYLERIASEPEAIHNLGIYYLINGELDKAEKALRTAAENGITEAAHNLNELIIKRENNRLMERYNR